MNVLMKNHGNTLIALIFILSAGSTKGHSAPGRTFSTLPSSGFVNLFERASVYGTSVFKSTDDFFVIRLDQTLLHDTLGRLSDTARQRNYSANGCGPQLLLAAPTNPVVDDNGDAFDWTYTPGYELPDYYEYTLDGGTLFQPVTTKPQLLPRDNYPVGKVGVRIREGLNNHASETIFNPIAYTAGATQENMIAFSEDFDGAASNGTWQALNCSTRDKAENNPLGKIGAVYLTVKDGSTGGSRLNTNYNSIPGISYTASIYVKYDNLQMVRIDMLGRQENVWAIFDIENGNVSGTGSACTANISKAGNNWYRVSLTFTETATNSPGKFSISNPTKLNRGDNSRGYFLFGAQMNKGNSPANYIKTP